MRPAQRYAALLRGINVGGAKRIAMADLRRWLEDLGWRNVRTLLASGNIVFEPPAQPAAKLAARIRATIAEQAGFDVEVVVKRADEIADAAATNPFGKVADDPSKLLVAFTADDASLAAVAKLAKADWGDERIHVGRHAAYVWCANGILESKAGTALLRDLQGLGTTRNWSTLQKLHAMLNETPKEKA
jgi:uncharacterized protein (DUF1697 family)